MPFHSSFESTTSTVPVSTSLANTDKDTGPAPNNGAALAEMVPGMLVQGIPLQDRPGGLDVEAAGPAEAKPLASTVPTSDLAPWRFGLLSIGVGFGLFLAMLDSSIVATSLLTIGRELGNLELINWVALAYTLAYLSCAVVFARIADIIGRRDAYLAAFVIFFGFSIGCGFAKTLHQLIALRALQGIGGSGLYSLSMVIWPEVAPTSLKRHIAAFAGIVIGVAGVLGPILGGLLTNYASWRWIFWINGPIGFVSMAVFALTWPNDKYLPHIQRHPWSSLDIIGSVLLVAAAALVTFAFQNAGVNPDQWDQAIFLAPLLTGVFAWMALFAWQRAIETRWKHIMPVFPLKLLRSRIYAFAMLTTLFIGFPFFATIFSYPLRLQVVNGKSGLMAGVMMLPLLGGVAVGSMLCGAINSIKNYLCETLVVACILMIVGCALETTLSDAEHLEPKALGFLPLIGLGLGLMAAASTTIAVIQAPPNDHAAAQGIVAQMRILGGSIGIAASSAILAKHEMSKLGMVISSEATSATGDSPTAGLVRQVFSAAFNETMRVCAIISAAGLLLACGTFQRQRRTLTEEREQVILRQTAGRKLERASPNQLPQDA